MTADEHNSRGVARMTERKFADAADEFRASLAINADHINALNNLGNALTRLGRLDEAIDAYHRVIARQPDLAEAHLNLAGALKNSGQIDAALNSYRTAAAIRPNAQIASALLYAMHLSDRVTPEALLAAHRDWNEQFAVPLRTERKPHENDRDPNRPLRVGYVSPDFTAHPVGRFTLPLLAHRDRKQFQITCYSDAVRHDAMTRMLQSAMPTWRDTAQLSDAQLAEQIRADQIDILVDLTMHAAGNRLLTFARKPAPVQVSYLAYSSATGLETVDHCLTDLQLGWDPAWPESPSYLPKTYWCYAPIVQTPIAPRRDAPIAFACLNNFAKGLATSACRLAEILARVPDSTLTLHAGAGAHRKRVQDYFAEQSIDPSRIRFVDRVPLGEYFAAYDRIDIALDPFPFNGATTTCDALWCGVPVVSVSTGTRISNAGRSVLTSAGLEEFAAGTIDDYVQTACELANDRNRLAELRATLRARLEASPLLDAASFVRDVEVGYRSMWRQWRKVWRRLRFMTLSANRSSRSRRM